MDKKLIEINSLSLDITDNSLKRLLELSNDEDEEVRFRSIEALANFNVTEVMINRVRQGLADVDELVRIECVELIGDWEDSESIELIYKCLGDSSELVRSAAITCLGQIGKEDTTAVLITKFQDLTGLERLSCAIALYTLGQEKYLDIALSFLFDQDYRVRCATANLVSNYSEDENKWYIISKLNEALQKEDTKAAASSISKAIKELGQ